MEQTDVFANKTGGRIKGNPLNQTTQMKTSYLKEGTDGDLGPVNNDHSLRSMARE